MTVSIIIKILRLNLQGQYPVSTCVYVSYGAPRYMKQWRRKMFLIGGLETEATKWLIVIPHGAQTFFWDLFFNHIITNSSRRLASHYMHLHHVCYYSRWPWWLLRVGGLALG